MDSALDVALEVRMQHATDANLASLYDRLCALPHVVDFLFASSPHLERALIIARSNEWTPLYAANQRQLTDRLWPRIRTELGLKVKPGATGKQLHQRLQLARVRLSLQNYDVLRCKMEDSAFRALVDKHTLDMDAETQRQQDRIPEQFRAWRVSNCSVEDFDEAVEKLENKLKSLPDGFSFSAAFLPSQEGAQDEQCYICNWWGFHYHYIARAKGVAIDSPLQMLESKDAAFQLERNEEKQGNLNYNTFYGRIRNTTDSDILGAFMEDEYSKQPLDSLCLFGQYKDDIRARKEARQAENRAKRARVEATKQAQERAEKAKREAEEKDISEAYYKFLDVDEEWKDMRDLRKDLQILTNSHYAPTTKKELINMLEDSFKRVNVDPEYEARIRKQIPEVWRRFRAFLKK